VLLTIGNFPIVGFMPSTRVREHLRRRGRALDRLIDRRRKDLVNSSRSIRWLCIDAGPKGAIWKIVPVCEIILPALGVPLAVLPRPFSS
jgi:hypothetical protein